MSTLRFNCRMNLDSIPWALNILIQTLKVSYAKIIQYSKHSIDNDFELLIAGVYK